ncbi:MAG: hypothetical protein ACRD1N_00785 [Terriglobia bacterium]
MNPIPISAEPEQVREDSNPSTGPRTLTGKIHCSLNALKHGRYAKGDSHLRAIRDAMIELGEDPEEFSQLQRELIASFKPKSPAEAMLVDDMASLRWERWRLERGQAALLARRVQKLEFKRQKLSLEVNQKSAALTEGFHKGHIGMGMIWVEDQPAKFQKLLEWLAQLQTCLDVHEFSEVDSMLQLIYGPNASLRGLQIRGLFSDLAEAGAGEPVDPVKVSMLRRELLAEISSVTQQYQLFLRGKCEVTPTMRQECLAPTEAQRWLMRQLNMVDRQIEKKTRLLLELQSLRQRRKHTKSTAAKGVKPAVRKTSIRDSFKGPAAQVAENK